MKILIACEYSGRMREAFRSRGFDAWSCDLYEPADDDSLFHVNGDALALAYNEPWDAMIAHPPCTYLASSGLHWNKRVEGRAERTEDALRFVKALLDAPIPHIALENPIGAISTRLRKPDPVVQPWMFGHNASKATCFWLKDLPLLAPTKIVEPEAYACCGMDLPPGVGVYGCANCLGEKRARARYGNQTPSGQNKLGPSADRWKIRSETYQGVADAAGEQWGNWIALSREFWA